MTQPIDAGEREKKYVTVHEILMRISRAQDVATYYGDSSGEVILLVQKSTDQILNLFGMGEAK